MKSEMEQMRQDASRAGRGYNNLVRDVVSPFLLSFVYWVVKNATTDGVDRLYFLSRDGKIMQRLACACFDNSAISFRYLYGSRQALYPLSLKQMDGEDELHWLMGRPMSISPRDVLERLNVAPEECAAELATNGFPRSVWEEQMSPLEIEAFREFLCSLRFQERVLETVRKHRRAALCYFREAGLLDGGKWAIVDTGWTLRSQYALDSLLREGGSAQRALGYYAGIKRGHLSIEKSGGCRALLMREREVGLEPFRVAPWFFSQGVSSVIEEVFTMTDERPVIGYGFNDQGSATPLFMQEGHDRSLVAFVLAHHDRVVAQALEDRARLGSESDWNDYLDSSLDKLQRFLQSPEEEEVKAISWIPLKNDQTHQQRHDRRLASPLTLSDIAGLAIYLLKGGRHYYPAPNHGWYRGCVAISSRWVKVLYALATRLRIA